MGKFLLRLKTRTGIVSSIAVLLLGFAFCRLGLWQLDRADEKSSMLEQQAAATTKAPLQSVQAGDGVLHQYRRVALTGSFDTEHQFLLDNRIVNGQPGFEVVTPFYLPDNTYVLVNRGWLGHSGDRQVTLESSAQMLGEISLEGILTTPSRGFTIGESVTHPENNTWPVMLQFMDYETIAIKLDKIPALDAVIVAASGQPWSYAYNWQPVASGAEKHLGYAFQWFAMLVALVSLYLYLMVFKNE